MSKNVDYEDISDYEGYHTESDDELEIDDDISDDNEDDEVEIIYEEFYNEKELSNRIIPKKIVGNPSVQKAGKVRIKQRNKK